MDQTPSSSNSHAPNPRSIEPEPARLRHSFLYSDRPRRSKRSTRVEEHVGEVSSREFEALTLDQSPPTPDSTHMVEENAGMTSGSESPTGNLPELKSLALNAAPPKPELSLRSIEPEPARLRHSFLYSDCPRRSKRSTRVEEHVGEVSSREFEALTLDQSPPTPDSTHRVEENAGMASGSESPTGNLPELKSLALNEAPPKPELSLRSKECDTESSETESEVLEESEDESDFDLEEERRKLKEYKGTMFDKDFAAQSTTLAASCDKISAVEHVTEYSGAAEWAKRAYLTQDEYLRSCLDAQRTMVASSRYKPRGEVSEEDIIQNEQKWSSEEVVSFDEYIGTNDILKDKSLHTMVASSRDEPRSEVSDEEIIQNANKWMSEEVMVAFEEYIGRNDKLKELNYCFEKLCHQCFNVECYFKIFHHFNFTVKTKLPSSDDWKPRTYFAEVKEIFGEKFYFCCPLESRENGQCYACHNQGADDLRHPATGGFERGLPDTVFPYM